MVLTAKTIMDTKEDSKTLGYAKISRTKLRNIAENEIDLTRAAIDLLLGMSRYIDSTSRIVIDLEMLSRKMSMQRKTFNHVMSQLLYKHLIYKKDGGYYSNFHIITTGESSTFEYIKTLEEFTSATFLNLTLNQKRLLSYFLTSSMLGSTQVYNVVKLYKNKIRKNKITEQQSGIDIFPTLKELLENLAVLIINDQIQVELKTDSDAIKLTSSSEVNIKETLLTHFGFKKDMKRSRTNFLKTFHEIIRVRISKRLCSQSEKVIASEYELNQFAMANNFSAYDLGSEQMNFLIGIKNDLVKFAGDTGASLYRKTIKKYFSEKKEFIISYAWNGKATNYYMDYYLLPEIRAILSDAALHQNIISNVNSEFTEILTNGQILPVNSIGNLVAFYIHKGSDNDLALLDKNLVRCAINKTALKGKPWINFKEKIEEIRYNFLLKTRNLPHEIQFKLFDYCVDNYLLTQDKELMDLIRILVANHSVQSTNSDLENSFKFACAYAEVKQINSPSKIDVLKDFDKLMNKNL